MMMMVWSGVWSRDSCRVTMHAGLGNAQADCHHQGESEGVRNWLQNKIYGSDLPSMHNSRSYRRQGKRCVDLLGKNQLYILYPFSARNSFSLLLILLGHHNPKEHLRSLPTILQVTKQPSVVTSRLLRKTDDWRLGKNLKTFLEPFFFLIVFRNCLKP